MTATCAEKSTHSVLSGLLGGGDHDSSLPSSITSLRQAQLRICRHRDSEREKSIKSAMRQFWQCTQALDQSPKRCTATPTSDSWARAARARITSKFSNSAPGAPSGSRGPYQRMRERCSSWRWRCSESQPLKGSALEDEPLGANIWQSRPLSLGPRRG